MNKKVPSAECQVPRNSWHGLYLVTRSPQRSWAKPGHVSRDTCQAFTLIEVLVVMALMGLIVLALMRVFDGTQTAFRSGVTQTDVLESGRAVTDLIKSDLEIMTPSLSASNAIVYASTTNNVNLYVAVRTYASPPSPLVQSLVGSSSGQLRTNVLEEFFILTRQNRTWTGIGYVVGTNSPDGALYPLYRFSMSTNMMAAGPASLYNAFASIPLTNSPPWSHLMDGVVGLRVRAYDTNGIWMNGTNGTYNAPNFCTNSTMWGETGFYMFSNMLPASVEVELGVLEDRTLQRAESLPVVAQPNYLAGHAGQVHIFRQRAWIRNMDPAAYK